MMYGEKDVLTKRHPTSPKPNNASWICIPGSVWCWQKWKNPRKKSYKFSPNIRKIVSNLPYAFIPKPTWLFWAVTCHVFTFAHGKRNIQDTFGWIHHLKSRHTSISQLTMAPQNNLTYLKHIIRVTSWWFQQPYEKYARQIGSFPQGSGCK